MSGLRITRVCCPHCAGQGYLSAGRHRCPVCCGNERISAADARVYAIAQRRMSDDNGAGELSWPNKRKCAAIAERIYELLQEVPPWRRHREAEG